jgi:ribonuclease PH
MSFEKLIHRDNTRPIEIKTNVIPYAYSSLEISFGQTKVLVTCSMEEKVPPFLRDQGKGWITAEYAMLPNSTHSRIKRERKGPSGRTQEIQRLIGRSLRSVVDLDKLGELTLTFDCDVIVADGGTRTTSISGAYIALDLAIKRLMQERLIKENPITHQLAAISVGIDKDGKVIADLNYEEDSQCQTDLNLVMTNALEFVEIQGTAEEKPFDHEYFMAMLEVGKRSITNVIKAQNQALGR